MTLIDPPADFEVRHLGPTRADISAMLKEVGYSSLGELVSQTIPESIRMEGELDLPPALSEAEFVNRLRRVASQNRVFRSFLGMGYSDTLVPGVILRNIMENPGWYTQYTPYQAEIAQGRLEALLNFQTMIIDLTGYCRKFFTSREIKFSAMQSRGHLHVAKGIIDSTTDMLRAHRETMLLLHVAPDFVGCDDRGACPPCQWNRICHMVVMAMGKQNEVGIEVFSGDFCYWIISEERVNN